MKLRSGRIASTRTKILPNMESEPTGLVNQSLEDILKPFKENIDVLDKALRN